MRPATFEPQQIIEAGLALQAEGRNITGFALRNRVGGGNPGRLKQVWDEYLSSQTEVTAEPVAELPVEVAEEVKAVSAALAERISQLASELNDKAVRAAERRVAEVTRAAGEQTAQAERELSDAAQTVDDLEDKLDGVTAELRKTFELLDASREREQERTINLTEVRERLTAAEKQQQEAEKAAKLADEQHRQQVEDLQIRLANAEKALVESGTQHATELRDLKAQHAAEIKELKSGHSRAESDLQKRLDAAEVRLAEAGTRHATELQDIRAQHIGEMKTSQANLAQAHKEAAEAREAKATMAGELKGLKAHNEQLVALLAGKNENIQK
ncbi:TPA: DNA-binding protein [Salmonella enterica subsp. enterica serovar Wyldegreen]|nr:DNA-binding protein [Salmonella enterica subsp. enterica serovar Wyldegreen]